SKIFEECFSTKPLGEGTGLGLSIARDIVTNFFRGTLSVESVLGQGTTFIVRLPCDKGMQEEPPVSERQPLPVTTEAASVLI
ncbi:MAG: hypothetical protein HYZ72_15305, partial [Deltaproteobacteria bacterium]|nr:hypothetical protein [Deltaproteobacteria bacterium]